LSSFRQNPEPNAERTGYRRGDYAWPHRNGAPGNIDFEVRRDASYLSQRNHGEDSGGNPQAEALFSHVSIILETPANFTKNPANWDAVTLLIKNRSANGR
jgi:hypothetical protein